jgi:hypothetical protein
MSSVYLDPGLLPSGVGDHEVDELRHLVDAGFGLVLLDDGHDASSAMRAATQAGLSVSRARTMDPGGRGDWLLTTDASRCGRARQTVCRTVLVGPVASDEPHPVSRCDFVARDLKSAVLQILTSEAMAGLA